ncbi:TIGR03619 family F420-dependent LLM class oxidoreductase [Micromonospora sp. NPDC020750]|uniref:TIGR03619 family F420-dependent LLM class oxidoreductase n=1 Tax=unclassified Micromonospora TaxID=2617518 RepID=UPI0037BD412B
MRFGILTPIVIRQPAEAAPWEATAGVAELSRIAQAADRLGYHHLTCSEHVAIPTAGAESRGSTYWDPLATLGYLAGRTQQIRLATNILVLGYHHPLAIAKSYGTLDQLSDGRVVLGVGVGSLEEEFNLLGAPFAGRGPRADDAIRALRAAWAKAVPEYAGPHYSFRDLVVDPHGCQPHLPIWVGGRTRRSLRRACELGDGWKPFGLTFTEIAALLRAVDRPAGFEVILQPRNLDPLGDPAGARSNVERVIEAGATVINTKFTHHSADHLIEQMVALTELFPDAGWTRPAPL